MTGNAFTTTTTAALPGLTAWRWLPARWLYPSRLGMSLLVLSSAFYLVAMHTQSGLLLLLLGGVFGCFVLNAIGAWRTVHCLRIMPSASGTAEENQLSRHAWQVVNSGGRAYGPAECFCRWSRLFRLPELPAHSQISRTPELCLARRGIYQIEYAWLRSSAPFGLLHALHRIKVDTSMIVYPAAQACPAPIAAGFEPVIGGSLRGSHRSACGAEFSGTRPLLPGDPVKLIHWPASAKGLGLQVREFHEELAGRTILVVDPGLFSSAASDLAAVARLDSLCRLTASLLFSALDAGNQVEVLMLDDGRIFSVPPFADPAPVLTALAGLLAQPNGAAVQAVLERHSPQLPRRAAVCWLLAEAPGPRPLWPAAAELLTRPKTLWYCPDDLAMPLPTAAGATVPVVRYTGNGGVRA